MSILDAQYSFLDGQYSFNPHILALEERERTLIAPDGQFKPPTGNLNSRIMAIIEWRMQSKVSNTGHLHFVNAELHYAKELLFNSVRVYIASTC